MSSMESVFRLSVMLNMIDNLSRPMVGVRQGIDSTVSSLEKMQTTSLNIAKKGAALAGTGIAITSALMKPVEATMETKRAIGELSSLGLQDLKLLENAATEFSNKWAGTTKPQFITAAYDIKSGIASLADDGVAKFTEFSGITATATKSTISEMTDLFATGYGIYKSYYSNMSDIQFGEMFSAGIAKSVQQFKTTGSGMAQAIQSLGASATNANVPMEEQLAILGMLQATMSGSEAGTKYSAFLRSAAKAGEELGLSFVDANKNLLSMPQILGILQNRFGDTLDAAEKMQLTKAFGTEEAIKLIDLLYGSTGALQNNILNLYDSMGQGIGVATEMANKINSTDPSKMDIVKQKIHNIAEMLGSALSPAVMDTLDTGSRLLGMVSVWAQNNQELAGGIMKTLFALGIFLSVTGVLAASMASVTYVGAGSIKMLRAMPGTLKLIGKNIASIPTALGLFGLKLQELGGYGLKALGAVKNVGIGIFNFGKQAIFAGIKAIPGLISSVWSFTAALLANPVTWIVIGVIALIGALYLLYKNWDKVTQFISGVWNSAATKASEMWTNISTSFNNAITNFLPKVRESGAKILTTLADGIRSVINKPAELVQEGLGKIRNMLPFSDAKVGPLSKLTLSGKRIFETITVGMNATKLMPLHLFENAMNFGKNSSGSSEGSDPGTKKTGSILQVIREASRSENNTTTDRTTIKGKDKKIIVQKVEYHFDIKDLKDITLMKRLLEDMEDIDNSIPDDDDLVMA